MVLCTTQLFFRLHCTWIYFHSCDRNSLSPKCDTPTVEELVKRYVPWQQGGVVGSLERRWRLSVDISFRPQHAFDLDLVSQKTLPRLRVTELGMWGDPIP